MHKRVFAPALFDCLKSYSGKQFAKDAVAGVIVAIIALPLSIALALASGVGPEQGIYTAIVAGFLISCFGGSRVQIAGPTAAFATIVAGIVAENGLGGLAVATVMAGIILILMGVLKLGSLIRFIPYTITTGFTAGIAVTIFIGQWKDFFGVSYGEKPIETMEKAACFFRSLDTVNLWAAAVEAVRERVVVIGLLETLEYLVRGGRLSAAAGAVGTLLNVKPVVAAEDGLIVQLGKARGSKNGRNLLNQKVEKAGGIDFSMPLALGYTGLSDAVLKKYIEDSAALWAGHTEGELPVHTIGATIGTHVGPGAVAVAFFHPAN